MAHSSWILSAKNTCYLSQSSLKYLWTYNYIRTFKRGSLVLSLYMFLEHLNFKSFNNSTCCWNIFMRQKNKTFITLSRNQSTICYTKWTENRWKQLSKKYMQKKDGKDEIILLKHNSSSLYTHKVLISLKNFSVVNYALP